MRRRRGQRRQSTPRGIERSFLGIARAGLFAVAIAAPAIASPQRSDAGVRRGAGGGGNAAEIYKRAFEHFDGNQPKALSQDEVTELWELTHAGRVLPKDADRVRELLTKVTPFLDAVAPAGTMRRSDFELDRSQGFMMIMPHLGQMRATARLLNAQAALALHDGDWEKSLSSMQSMAWIGNHAGQDQVLISSLVGTATTSLAMNPLDAMLDEGTLTQERASALLEALRGIRGDDPFQYADSMRGEYRLIVAQLDGADGAAVMETLGPIMQLDGMDEDSIRNLSQREVSMALARARGVYDRAASAFASDDPDVARQLMEEVDRESKRSPLLAVLMPSLEKALRSKQMISVAIAERLERLEAIAKGRKTALEMANASAWFRRAAAIASGLPEDGQSALSLALVGGASIDESLLERAERIQLGAGRQIRECLERGLACGTVDFDVPNDGDFGLSAKWLPGLRGAARVMLAQATVADAPERAELGLIVAGTALALTKDPSSLRGLVARSIVDESLPVLRRIAAESALAPAEREAFAETLRRLGTGLLAAPEAGANADRDRLSAATPWGRTIDPRRRKVLSNRGPEFLLFVQVALAPSGWFPMADSGEVGAKGPLVQFEDILPVDSCAAAQKQQEKLQALPFFDSLRFGPDPDAEPSTLRVFRGVTTVPIRDLGKDQGDLSRTLDRLGEIAERMEKSSAESK